MFRFTAMLLASILAVICQGRKFSSSPLFSRNERIEQNRVWNVIKKHCFGCWSGGIRYYVLNDDDKEKENGQPQMQLKLKHPTPDDHQELNVRLHAKPTSKINLPFTNAKGTWTVWNSMTNKSIIIPLQQRPTTTRTTTNQVAFEDGVVVRVSKVPQKCMAIELGYWDNKSGGSRIAAVEYDDFQFRELATVQMKKTHHQHQRRSGHRFVESFHETNRDGSVLPPPPSWDMKDMVDLRKLELARSETVNLRTMKRSKWKQRRNGGRDANCYEQEQAMAALKSLLLLGTGDNNRSTTHITEVLTNGLCISIPKKLVSADANRMIFAHQWKRNGHRLGQFQALVIEFDPISQEATSVTMHYFNVRKLLFSTICHYFWVPKPCSLRVCHRFWGPKPLQLI